jgi:hypothetical protein
MPRLTIHNATLHLDGRPWAMRAGELQYFRIERKRWERSLARMRTLGFNAVTTYIPWVWHEPEPDHYDFMGAGDRRRDLLGFLRAAQAEGLVVVARPGPYINAEYQGFGYPRWLARHIPQAVMQGPAGQPVGGAFWDAFAPGHADYRAAVQRWYETVAGVLDEFWDRPVVAWQVDNETGFLQMNGLGRWDWNPDTLARFHAWLARRYDTVAAVNAAWGVRYRDFATIRPPRPPFQQGLVNDWQHFLEDEVVDYLSWAGATARAAGVPVPLCHNEAAYFLSPSNPARKAITPGVELYGYDLYLKLSAAPVPADYPWAATYVPALFRAFTPTTRPLLCWELGAGWFDPRARTDDTILVQNLAGGVAHGLQGFSLYIAQDGVEANGQPYTYGTIWDHTGQPGPRHAITARLLAFLQEHEATLLQGTEGEPADAPKSKIQNPKSLVGFAYYYPDTRFAAGDYLPGQTLQDPSRALAGLFGAAGVYGALVAAGYGPQLRIIDLEAATAADLTACAVLVFPSKGRVDPAVYTRLRAYVAAGGRLVTCGRAPRHTLHGRPLDEATDLYPAAPARCAFLPRGPILAHMVRAWLLDYRVRDRAWLAARHATSMHLLDSTAPLLAALHAPQEGFTLAGWGRGVLRGDLVLETYQDPAEPLLWHGETPAAYVAHHGAGTSTMLGTLPGGSYATPTYYRLRPQERQGIRTFWQGLLSERGVPPAITTNPGLEVGVQIYPAGEATLLVVSNHRAERQQGCIRLPGPVAGLRVLFGGVNSNLHLRGGSLGVDLAPGDAVIALLNRSPD